MVSSGLCDDSPYSDADFLAGSWTGPRGERFELEGDVAGNALVLTGAERVAGGEVHYRLTLTPAGSHVEAKHEISRNGGTTWVRLPTLSYVK